MVYVDVTTVGDFLEAGDTFGAIEAVKTVADAYMPLSGDVVEMNEELEAAPQLVNQDPYGQGWIIRINISNPEEISGLLSPEAYGKLI